MIALHRRQLEELARDNAHMYRLLQMYDHGVMTETDWTLFALKHLCTVIDAQHRQLVDTVMKMPMQLLLGTKEAADLKIGVPTCKRCGFVVCRCDGVGGVADVFGVKGDRPDDRHVIEVHVPCDDCGSALFDCTGHCRRWACTKCEWRGKEDDCAPGREGSWDCPTCGHKLVQVAGEAK